jgi:uncharacterized protein
LVADEGHFLNGEITEIGGLTFPNAVRRVRQLMSKQHFYVKLIPPRPTFTVDMTSDERAIMQRHVDYTTGLFAEGKVLIFGPVLDASYPFGMAVFEVENESEVVQLLNGDPSVACGLNQFTVIPMRVGAAQGTSPK